MHDCRRHRQAAPASNPPASSTLGHVNLNLGIALPLTIPLGAPRRAVSVGASGSGAGSGSTSASASQHWGPLRGESMRRVERTEATVLIHLIRDRDVRGIEEDRRKSYKKT